MTANVNKKNCSAFRLLLFVFKFFRYVTNIYKYFEAQGVQGPKPKFLVGTWSELSKKVR